jgi:hypothetical protein
VASGCAPPDVLEVDIDALGAVVAQLVRQIGHLSVVERCVYAGFVQQPGDLDGGSGAPDHATALDFGDLEATAPTAPAAAETKTV